jgi:hypothetical protein
MLEASGKASAGLVDVRSPAEFRGDLLSPPGLPETCQCGGHIPGASSVPWGSVCREDGTFKSSAELAELYASVGIAPGRPVIAASHDGAAGRAWHEASVATLAFFDRQGARLKTTYVARMPESGKMTTVDTLERELLAVVGELPDVNIAFASDGAAPQWTSLAAIKSRLPASFTGHTMDLVNAFHAAEYVQEAAEALEETDSADARILAATRRETPEERDDGAAIDESAPCQRRPRGATQGV